MKLRITFDTRIANLFVEKLHVRNFFSQNRNFSPLFREDSKICSNTLAPYESLQKVSHLIKQTFATKIVWLTQEAHIDRIPAYSENKGSWFESGC